MIERNDKDREENSDENKQTVDRSWIHSWNIAKMDTQTSRYSMMLILMRVNEEMQREFIRAWRISGTETGI